MKRVILILLSALCVGSEAFAEACTCASGGGLACRTTVECKSMLRSAIVACLLALSLLGGAAEAATCTFNAGSSNWGPIGTVTGAGTSCGTPTASDTYVIPSGASVTVVAAITQDTTGGIGITVNAGGTLTAAVSESVNSGNSLVLTVGAAGLSCSGTCTLTGGFRQFGSATSQTLADFSTSDFWQVGEITEARWPAGGTGTITYPTTATAGHDYDSANGVDGDTNIAESIAEVTTSDAICFFDPDTADEYVPADVNACYKVSAVDAAAADYSISVDLRQGAQDNASWPLAKRDIQVGTLGADVIRGQMTLNLGAAFADAAAAAAIVGRWIRLEDGASGVFAGRAYRIITAADNGSDDTVTIIDLRGAGSAHAAGDAWAIESQGWVKGDPFYIMVPVRITSATAALTDSPVLLNGASTVRGVVFDSIQAVTVGVSSGVPLLTASLSQFRDVWIIDPSNATSSALSVGVAGALLERVSITGNDASVNTTHGFAFYEQVPVTLRDALCRYLGDDCFGYINNSSGEAATAFSGVRIRSEYAENATGGSTNVAEAQNGGTNNLTYQLSGISCVRCTTDDASGGIFAVGSSTTSTITADGVTWIGGRGKLSVGTNPGRLTATNVAGYGHVMKTVSGVAFGGNLDGFVFRGGDGTTADIIGAIGALGVTVKNGLVLDTIWSSNTFAAVAPLANSTFENIAFVNVNRTPALNTGVFRWSGDPGGAVRLENISVVWNPRYATVGFQNAIRDNGSGAWSNVTFKNLLFAGLHDFAGTNAQAAIRGGSASFWAGNTWAGKMCFYGNEADLSGSIPAPTPFDEVRDRPFGWTAVTTVLTQAGSVIAGINDCGVKGGAQAPGLKRLTWGQMVNQLPVERATEAAPGERRGWIPSTF